MKKLLGIICSSVASVFTFILFSLNWLSVKNGGAINAWDIMKDSSNVNGYSLFKLAGVLLIILAILLIANIIVIILQNLNIIKLKFDFGKLNSILLTSFAVLSILMLIASYIMAADLSYTETIMGINVSVTTNVAIGGWLMAILGIVVSCVAWIFGRKSANK